MILLIGITSRRRERPSQEESDNVDENKYLMALAFSNSGPYSGPVRSSFLHLTFCLCALAKSLEMSLFLNVTHSIL
jgi:hypothetical protein